MPDETWPYRLRSTFDRVTIGANGDEERVTRLLSWLQRRIYPIFYTPVDTAGAMVFDPIWILTNGVGQCGQTNRVLVDILIAAGYPARLIQLKGHVAAEVYYDSDWHYLDADALSPGDEIHRDASGALPSTAEIAADPDLVSHLTVYRELLNEGRQPGMAYAAVFEPWEDPATGLTTPFAYIKTATDRQLLTRFYGWNHYEAVELSERRPEGTG